MSSFRLCTRKKVFYFSLLLLFTSCQERITYKWSEINESLGKLQDAREELRSVISELEYIEYDCSDLEAVDANLKRVERIIDSRFY